jgi:hypothetical protein
VLASFFVSPLGRGCGRRRPFAGTQKRFGQLLLACLLIAEGASASTGNRDIAPHGRSKLANTQYRKIVQGGDILKGARHTSSDQCVVQHTKITLEGLTQIDADK